MLFQILFIAIVKSKKTTLFSKVLSGLSKGLDKGKVLQQLKSLPDKARIELERDFRQIISSAGNIKRSIRIFLSKPEAFSRALSTMKTTELKKINKLVSQELEKRAKQSESDKTKNRIEEAQKGYTLMSSSWIGEMWYDKGKMYIRTHTGWEGALRDRISFGTFELMVKAKGRNGTGAGSVLWRREWVKYRSSASKKKLQKNIVFKQAT